MVKILFLKGCGACFGNFLVLQRCLMGCNIISKCGKNLQIFQNPFLTRIPYSSWQHGKKTLEIILPSDQIS